MHGAFPIPKTIDRLQESHWYLHQMEEFYHQANPFRYSLGSFFRSLSEIAEIMKKELQHAPGFKEWSKHYFKRLQEDELLVCLKKKRNKLVHHDMLIPSSRLWIGMTEGRGMKLGFTTSMDPSLDSDQAWDGYFLAHPDVMDPLGLLGDEDALPCVERTWRLMEFPDDEIPDLAAKAWQTVARMVADVLNRLSQDNLPPEFLGLHCRHGFDKVRVKIYHRDALEEYGRKLRGERSG